jgi:hypothetical protein
MTFSVVELKGSVAKANTNDFCLTWFYVTDLPFTIIRSREYMEGCSHTHIIANESQSVCIAGEHKSVPNVEKLENPIHMDVEQ